MNRHAYFVYIMSNVSRTLYIGVTNDLERRVAQHRSKEHEGFVRQYNVTMLVHMEEFSDIRDALAREKQLKNWNRSKKIRLIEQLNPTWTDLAKDWFPPVIPASKHAFIPTTNQSVIPTEAEGSLVAGRHGAGGVASERVTRDSSTALGMTGQAPGMTGEHPK